MSASEPQPAAPEPKYRWQQHCLRLPTVVTAIAVVFLSMACSYSVMQGIGAALGVSLFLSGIRKLGACAVTVGDAHVYVYIGGHCGEGFFIYRTPHPEPPIGSDTWMITDRLWYYEGT